MQLTIILIKEQIKLIQDIVLEPNLIQRLLNIEINGILKALK